MRRKGVPVPGNEVIPADWRCPPCKQPKAKFNPA